MDVLTRRRWTPLPVLVTALLTVALIASRLSVVLLAAAPTLISYTEAASWITNVVSKSTAAVSWQTGDVVVVVAGQEDVSAVLAVPTATGLTFTSQRSNTTASTCGTQLATAVAASNGSSAVSMTGSGSAHWGFGVWVVRTSTGVGNSAEQHTSAKTVSLTPTAANGLIIWGVFDFNADAAGSGTPAPTNTRQAAQDAGHYTRLVVDLADQSSAGAVSYGQSGGGTTGPFSIVAIEIKNDGGGGAPPSPKRLSLLGVGGV